MLAALPVSAPARPAAPRKVLVLAHAARAPGYERTLAQTLEAIDRCIALSEASHQKLRRLQ